MLFYTATYEKRLILNTLSKLQQLIQSKVIKLDVVQKITEQILIAAKEEYTTPRNNVFFSQPFDGFYIETHNRFPQYISQEIEDLCNSQSFGSPSNDDYLSSGFQKSPKPTQTNENTPQSPPTLELMSEFNAFAHHQRTSTFKSRLLNLFSLNNETT